MDVVEEKVNEKDSPALLDIGALLVEARENQNLSSQDIADQMNLTLSVITKIEANEFKQDIPLAFIRGYVSSYAKKVGVDVENLCAEFDKQTGLASEPVQKIKTVSDFKSRRKEMNSNSFVFKLLTYLIVTSLLAFGGWELWKKLNQPKNDSPVVQELSLNSNQTALADSVDSAAPSESASTATDSASLDNQSATLAEETLAKTSQGTADEPPATSVNDAIDVPDSNLSESEQFVSENVAQQGDSASQSLANTNSANLTPASEQTLSADAASTAPADENNSTLVTGPVKSMTFEFSADCWVQVTDANGEVLAIGIKRIGKVMPLEGVAPFTVILGEPSAVSIEFEGDVYDLSRFRAGRTARFVLE